MSVILLILKIIGIVLLCLIGLLAAAVLLVLFVPVRYIVSGEITDHVSVRGRVTWLFRILSLRFSYVEEEYEQMLRICGIRWKKKREHITEEEFFDEAETFAEDAEEEAGSAEGVPEETGNRSNGVMPEEAIKRDAGDRGRKQDGGGKAKKFFAKIKRKWDHMKRALKQMKEKVFDIKNIITDETNKTAVVYTFQELKYLLTHFRFRKIDTELSFSLGDPALTGQALGILCMLPFLYQYAFHMYPDFESEQIYIRGTFQVQGRVRGIHLLLSIIRLWQRKEFRIFVKRLMK